MIRQKIVDCINGPVPAYKDPCADALRKMARFSIFSMWAIILAFTLYAYFVAGTYPGAYSIAAVGWVPTMFPILRAGTYAPRVEAMADKDGAESARRFYRHARNVVVAFYALAVLAIAGFTALVT